MFFSTEKLYLCVKKPNYERIIKYTVSNVQSTNRVEHKRNSNRSYKIIKVNPLT